MKLNKHSIRKENVISIVITAFFILGFIILSNFGISSIGYSVLDNQTSNETFEQNITINESLTLQENTIINETVEQEVLLNESQNLTLIETNMSENNLTESIISNLTFDANDSESSLLFGTQGSGDQVINIQAPVNNTNTYARYINFTYNVSDTDNNINNCSLFLNTDGAGYTDITAQMGNTWINQSDGFTTTAFATSPQTYGITTNGSDFWITEANSYYYVYHATKAGVNVSDGFSTVNIGSTSAFGITTNGSDFWIADNSDHWVYHTNKSGYNYSDGFATIPIGSAGPRGITTNGSDLWITDIFDYFVYHTNLSGYNYSDGFSTLALGSNLPQGITTNGSDFWITDYTDNFVYHTNRTGGNMTDGFGVLSMGISQLFGITTPSFIMAEGGGGSPTEFWFTDATDKWIYHVKKQITESINQSINKSFDSSSHSIYWKVGCYDDASVQVNSSEYYLYLNSPSIINIQEPVNETNTYARYINFTFNVSDIDNGIDNCSLFMNVDALGYQNNITLNQSEIIEGLNNSINKSFDSNNHTIYWKVGCYDDSSTQTNSSEYYLYLNQLQAVNIQAPVNNTNTYARYINFTYNVSDADNAIDNCSLFLNTDGAGYTDITTDSGVWTNQSDGFSTSKIGSNVPKGITTNGSDFWVIDVWDNWVYHMNNSGSNISNGFTLKNFRTDNCFISIGTENVHDITTNATDFWIVDRCNYWVYHTNKSGYNFTDGFSASAIGSSATTSITTNGSDFWIADIEDFWIYHTNKSGYNFTDGFSASAIGSSATTSITTNGSDFWIVDSSDAFVYHTNMSGYNYSDGISTSIIGSSAPFGIITISAFAGIEQSGPPSDFWIVDNSDSFVYHIKKQISETINQSINKSFDSNNHTIYWKVGCTADDLVQVNTSEYYLYLNAAPIINIQAPVNETNTYARYINFTFNVSDIDNDVINCSLFMNVDGVGYSNVTFNQSEIIEGINTSINKSFDSNNHSIYWTIGCYSDDTQTNSSEYYLYLNQPQAVNLLYPENNTVVCVTYNREMNFTYNVSDVDNPIDNCTLWMDIDGAGYEANVSISTTITEGINQTFNKTFDKLNHTIYWKVGCFANDSYQVNATYQRLLFNANPVIELISPSNNARTTEKSLTFTYNITDLDNDVSNCSLYLNYNLTAFELNQTDTTIVEITHQTFSASMSNDIYILDWMISCYSDNSKQENSTSWRIITSNTSTSYTPSAPGGGGGGKPSPRVVQSVSKPTYLLFQAPSAALDKESKLVMQRIDLDRMNLDPAFSNLLGEVIVEIDIDKVPKSSLVGMFNKSLHITVSDEVKVDVKFEGRVPSIFIQEIPSNFTIKPEMISLYKDNLRIAMLVLILIILSYFIVIGGKKFVKVDVNEVTDEINKIKALSRKITHPRSPSTFSPQIKKSVENKPPVIQSISEGVPKLYEDTSTYEINNGISKFDRLLESIKANIKRNDLIQAGKQYEELKSAYSLLIIKVNKNDQTKLYNLMNEIYHSLNDAMDVSYLSKKLNGDHKS